jgi:plastocyanin
VRRIGAVGLAVVVLGLLLGACGGDDSDGGVAAQAERSTTIVTSRATTTSTTAASGGATSSTVTTGPAGSTPAPASTPPATTATTTAPQPTTTAPPATTAPPTTAPTTDVSVRAADFAFSPKGLSAPAGTIRFHASNDDAAAHTFTVDGTGVDIALPPNGSGDATAVLAAGSYEFACRIHGSMTGTLTVT